MVKLKVELLLLLSFEMSTNVQSSLKLNGMSMTDGVERMFDVTLNPIRKVD